jgi:DNA-binding NarL/FixJ family response regulator
MPVSVSIFEDNEKFLDAFCILIQKIPELELVGAFENTSGLKEKISSQPPDIVLMDIAITPVNGIEATRFIVKNFPSVKVLIQTVFDEDDKVFAAICAGASGYVLKTIHTESLLPYIFEAHQGGAPMSPAIASKTLKLFRNHFPAGEQYENYKLSKREKEILKLLVDGYSYKMIADRCQLSFETVKTYIKRIYEKLHVASMTEAVAKAIYENLI